ncbi:hypothetical protein JCM10207_004782 [Rhodosporidiobolus poonsookiae]
MASSRPSSASSTPFSSSSAVTRSMSRRSLAAGQAGALGENSTASGLAGPLSSRLPASKTHDSLSTASSNISRSRTSSAAASKTASLTSSARPRRVLTSHNSSGASSSTTASFKPRTASSAASTNLVKSPPRRGRLSRAQASQMSGMGVVRAGPAVQGRSPSKSASAPTLGGTGGVRSENDPFSTAFVRPTFDFEVSVERVHGVGQQREVRPLPSGEAVESRRKTGGLGAMKMDEDGCARDRMYADEEDSLPLPTATNPFDLTSPKKRADGPPRSPTKGFLAIPAPVPTAMDVDGPTSFSMQPSSPFRGALSPRTLSGRTFPPETNASKTGSVRRKLDEVDLSSDEDDDELDFLSPRKKARPTMPSPAPAPAPSASSVALPPPAPRQPGLRSPPPKKKLPSSAAVRAQVQAAAGSTSMAALRASSQPASVAMQRTSGRAFPLPDLTAVGPPTSKLPRSLPIQSLDAVQPVAPPPTLPAVEAAEPKNRILPPSLTGPNLSTAVSQPMTRSGRAMSIVGRPAALASTMAPPPAGTSRLPRPAPRAAVAAAAVPPPSTDTSMAIDVPSTSSADLSTLSTTSTSTVTSTRSEETARRLANLQSMLSRLQMPASRRTSGGAGNASITSTSMSMAVGDTSRESSVPIAPPAESAPVRRTSVGRAGSRTSLGSTGSAAPQQGAVAGSSRRRSSVVAPRPVGGIINTSSALANASFSGGAPSLSSASAPSLSAAPPLRASTSHRRSSSAAGTSFAHQSSFSFSLDSIADAAEGGAEKEKKNVLQGVVAFVDVRTIEGDDSGMMFVDLLKGMGARVTTRPSSLTTHIIFKSGRPSTLTYYRSLRSTRPHLVGIAWIVRCAEVGQRVDEAPFRVEDVDGGKENAGAGAAGKAAQKGTKREIGAMAQAALGMSSGPGPKGGASGAAKRRRSMEPKALASLAAANTSISSAADSALKASIAASIERARRKSLLYAPKVGSPLAKRVFVLPDQQPNEEDDE